MYTQTRWALTLTFAREELMVLQLLNCEISSLISSITSVSQCRLQTGLVPYCWGCLTLPITRTCLQLLRALPRFNHLDLNSSCWVYASGWIHFRKCQPKSENMCIKKNLTICMWMVLLPPCALQEGFDIWQADLCVRDEHALKVCRKTLRSPNLLQSPAFGQGAGPKWGFGVTHSGCAFAWEASAAMQSKNVLHYHHWK